MNGLDYGRTLMGDSLGFHIIFALLGVGVPLLISLAELISILRKDNQFYITAKRWTYVLAVLFVAGAVSGTIISIQFSTVWPVYTAFVGKVVGLSFYLETFAFFIEAIFLGIYLYTWNRFRGKFTHWLCSLPIVIGGAASAFSITTANAFMNNPQGFTLKNGILSNINPIKAIFNHATFSETTHSIMAYYLTTALFFAGIYCLMLIKTKKRAAKQETPENSALADYYKKIIKFLMPIALLFAILVLLSGDSSAKYIAKYEPLKFAAAESLFNTQTHAPLQIGGIIKNGTLKGAIKIPDLLSILAFGSRNAAVKGLSAFDPNFWPPLVIHYFFDSMVGIGILITLVPVIYLLDLRKRIAYSKPMLYLAFLCGLLSFAAVEFGWMLTEIGRQPWVIKDIMTTEQAFTTSKHVIEFGYIFPTLYVVLFVATIWVLRRHFKRNPADLNNSNSKY